MSMGCGFLTNMQWSALNIFSRFYHQ